MGANKDLENKILQENALEDDALDAVSGGVGAPVMSNLMMNQNTKARIGNAMMTDKTNYQAVPLGGVQPGSEQQEAPQPLFNQNVMKC